MIGRLQLTFKFYRTPHYTSLNIKMDDSEEKTFDQVETQELFSGIYTLSDVSLSPRINLTKPNFKSKPQAKNTFCHF